LLRCTRNPCARNGPQTAAHTRHGTLSRFTNRQISVCLLEEIATMLTFAWSGSRVVVKRSSCRQSPWYPPSSPFYCWASRRHTPRRGVPSTVAGEVERIVASIPFNNAWPRSREMVGSAPRTNSKIPIGVVGRGPVRGEVRFGVIVPLTPAQTSGPNTAPLVRRQRRVERASKFAPETMPQFSRLYLGF
jgi:hypothetical protein